MRRIVDLGIPIFQLAVRSLSDTEHQFRQARKIPHLDAVEFAENGIPATLLPKAFPKKIYLTFDIDALDPSLVPGTGTPEPGGLFWWDALRLLRRVMTGRHVLGFDIVEVAPQAGTHVSEFTAARLADYLRREGGRAALPAAGAPVSFTGRRVEPTEAGGPEEGRALWEGGAGKVPRCSRGTQVA